MDRILNTSTQRKNRQFNNSWEASMEALHEHKLPLGERVRRGLNQADLAHLVYKLVHPVSFFALAAVLGILGVFKTVYTPAYMVTLDGMPVGTVVEIADFELAVSDVESRVSDILGYDYQIEGTIAYESALVSRGTVSPIADFEDYLFGNVTEVVQSYVLTLDGEVLGVAPSDEAFVEMIEAIQAPYITEYTTDVAFVGDMELTYEYTAVTEEADVESIYAMLTENTSGQTIYEVVSGDTFMALAYANGMNMEELEALNPDVDVDRLYIGQLLNIKQEVPYLSVRTVEEITYNEAISCPIEEVPDDSMYQGESRTIDAGIEGEAFVTAEVVYLNGYESEHNVLESVTLSEPTTKVIAVGTVARPTWYPNGYFIWPTYGTISSYFGYRTIYGSTSYHSGLDIAASYGNSIMAADGGTVTWSGTGTGSNWSYGNYVIIDHGDGKETLYAHCSSLLVSAGDKVYQGQTIARVGSTGRSTGNHCHFEVRINGTAVNPLSYLP